MHLARWLGLDPLGEPAYIAIIKGPNGPLSVTVDDIDSVIPVNEEQLITANAKERERAVAAITPDLTSILDVDVLLQAADLTQARR